MSAVKSFMCQGVMINCIFKLCKPDKIPVYVLLTKLCLSPSLSCVKSVKCIYKQHETSGKNQSGTICVCFFKDSTLLWVFTIITNLK